MLFSERKTMGDPFSVKMVWLGYYSQYLVTQELQFRETRDEDPVDFSWDRISSSIFPPSTSRGKLTQEADQKNTHQIKWTTECIIQWKRQGNTNI